MGAIPSEPVEKYPIFIFIYKYFTDSDFNGREENIIKIFNMINKGR